jgi:ESF2/ABP1 family protein
VLNLKYLPKFKWENLTEKITYDMKMRKEKLKAELSLAKKQHDHYLDQVEKGKKIMGIKKYKVNLKRNKV